MKILLSPAKTQSFCEQMQNFKIAEPKFINEAKILLNLLMKHTPSELATLYKIKPEKAETLFELYRSNISGHALLSYNGIVFKSMTLSTWEDHDFDFANDVTYICSALYGLLKPLDEIKPYRLDMTHKVLENSKLSNYWSEHWNVELEKEPLILNLASKEFSDIIDHPQMVTVEFYDLKNDEYKKINTYVKMARGKLYNLLIKNRITTINEIKQLEFSGYTFAKELSNVSTLAFARAEAIE